jgi:peptide/nickel transport system substrate-binding protein
VGQGPASISAAEDGVWVANTQDNAVARIDPRTSAAIETIKVGRRPTGVAAGGGAVWVANSLSGTVSRIDPETNRLEATVEVGEAPQSLTVANGLVWVSVQERAAALKAPPRSAPRDVVRVVALGDPGPLDPALNSDYEIQYATCALLYNYPDLPFPAGARLRPEVARGWPAVSSGGKTYRFRIRPGYRFSPPASDPVTAASFQRAIERALSPRTGSFARELMGDIAGAGPYIAGRTRTLRGVTARGDTLTIRLSRPAPDLIVRLSTTYFCAVPAETPIVPEGVDAIPSAGPYYVASHVPDRSIVLRRNPGYGGPRPQRPAEIRYSLGVPPERGVVDVEAGRADDVALNPILSPPVSSHVARELERRYGPLSEAARAGRQQLFTQPTSYLYYFIFNSRRLPFSEVKLRRAVNYAIDRPALAQNTGVGPPGRPTDQYIPPGLPGFENAAVYPVSGPDVAAAHRLAGAGRRHAVLYTCSLPSCTRHAQILRSNLRAIGIDLDVRQFPLEEMFTRLHRPGEPWDIGYWNWFADYPDPSNFINAQFAGGGGATVPGVAHAPLFERRMKAAANLQLRVANTLGPGVLSGNPRARAYARLDRDLARQLAPAAPFASGTASHFLAARIGCEVLNPIYGLDLAALCVGPDSG